jgi:ATP-dependent protease ClpP protease subunit
MAQLSFYFDDEINEETKNIFVQAIINRRATEPPITEILVFLNSTGGQPIPSYTLYNLLKNLIPENINTIVVNIGTVASAAVNFYLGFKERYCLPESSFMIHNTVFNNVSGDYRKLRLFANDNLIADEKTRTIIIRETIDSAVLPFTDPELVRCMDVTTTFTDIEAIDRGICHAIKKIHIPESALYITSTSRKA